MLELALAQWLAFLATLLSGGSVLVHGLRRGWLGRRRSRPCPEHHELRELRRPADLRRRGAVASQYCGHHGSAVTSVLVGAFVCSAGAFLGVVILRLGGVLGG